MLSLAQRQNTKPTDLSKNKYLDLLFIKLQCRKWRHHRNDPTDGDPWQASNNKTPSTKESCRALRRNPINQGTKLTRNLHRPKKEPTQNQESITISKRQKP